MKNLVLILIVFLAQARSPKRNCTLNLSSTGAIRRQGFLAYDKNIKESGPG
jgi:hypothetical protein